MSLPNKGANQGTNLQQTDISPSGQILTKTDTSDSKQNSRPLDRMSSLIRSFSKKGEIVSQPSTNSTEDQPPSHPPNYTRKARLSTGQIHAKIRASSFQPDRAGMKRHSFLMPENTLMRSFTGKDNSKVNLTDEESHVYPVMPKSAALPSKTRTVQNENTIKPESKVNSNFKDGMEQPKNTVKLKKEVSISEPIKSASIASDSKSSESSESEEPAIESQEGLKSIPNENQSIMNNISRSAYISTYMFLAAEDTNYLYLHYAFLLIISAFLLADISRLGFLKVNQYPLYLVSFVCVVYSVIFGLVQYLMEEKDCFVILILWIMSGFFDYIRPLQFDSNNTPKINSSLVITFFVSIVAYIISKVVKSSKGLESYPLKYEGLFLVICCITMFSVLLLERDIHLTQEDMLDEEEGVENLVVLNLDLQRQLRVAKISPSESDISAPLTRAHEILLSLTQNDNVSFQVKEALHELLGILNEDKLFEPEFMKLTGDAEVTNFLQDVVQTRKTLLPSHTRMTRPSNTVYSFSDRMNTVNSLNGKAKLDNQFDSKNALLNLLEDFNESFFDCYELEVASEGHSLFYLGNAIFNAHDFANELGVNIKTFRNWLIKMESGYDRNNPYHNHIHAADVLQCLHYFITRDTFRKHLTTEDIFACIIAAAGHDYMHPGFTNAFLIATRNPLASRYNDQSVLEHFHIASIYEMFQLPEYNILESFSKEQRQYIREMIISMILATDMTFHFEWSSRFKNKVSTKSLNFESQNDKKLAMIMAMKCSDVNNLSKPLPQSRMWTQLIMEEFFKQGDQERLRGMPISMFMDRHSTDIPKCQIGFIDYIVLPLYESWSSFCDVKEHVRNINATKAYWKSVMDAGMDVERVEVPKVNVVPLKLKESQFPRAVSASTSSRTGAIEKEDSGMLIIGLPTDEYTPQTPQKSFGRASLTVKGRSKDPKSE